MAMDEALLCEAITDSQPPVLRLYSWSRPTVSIGYHQKVSGRFDLARCKERGVDIVRRPTGGREVLHLGELTYAFCISRASLRRTGTGFRSTMELMGEVFRRALELLGISSERIGLGRARKGSGDVRKPRLQPCFASLSQYEVSVDGRKLVGSAQKSLPEAFLQHGSILLTPRGLEVVDLLEGGCGDRDSLREALRKKSTSLEELLNGEVEALDLTSSLREAFVDSLDFELTDSELSPRELAAGLELLRTKYESSRWYYPA